MTKKRDIYNERGDKPVEIEKIRDTGERLKAEIDRLVELSEKGEHIAFSFVSYTPGNERDGMDMLVCNSGRNDLVVEGLSALIAADEETFKRIVDRIILALTVAVGIAEDEMEGTTNRILN